MIHLIKSSSSCAPINNMYNVKSEQFNGPLDKLLELIEEKKLEITLVNLASVTQDFISYVESLSEGVSAQILADFVAVASRLLVIKSKVLLPGLELTEDEQVDIHDLENRLKIYREFKVAGAHASALWSAGRVSRARPFLASLGEKSFFYPPKELDPIDLQTAMVRLFKLLEGLMPETKTLRTVIVTLQEKIAELAGRLTKAVSMSFKSTFGSGTKQEVIVSFLAILHMLANKMADVEQGDQFGDILIKKTQLPITNDQSNG